MIVNSFWCVVASKVKERVIDQTNWSWFSTLKHALHANFQIGIFVTTSIILDKSVNNTNVYSAWIPFFTIMAEKRKLDSIWYKFRIPVSMAESFETTMKMMFI